MLIGFALLVVGGIAAYPSLRDSLGMAQPPQGFGDESALSASIVQVDESMPQRRPDTLSTETGTAAPLVLPETPLLSEASPTTEPAAPAVNPPTAESAPSRDTSFEPAAPSRLVIATIGLDAPVDTVGWSISTQNGQQVSMWNVPNRFAAGWLRTTARVGEPGNTVLDGHHNIAGEVFRDLNLLKEGDSIQVWAGGRLRDYVVSLMKILPEKGQSIEVRLNNARWIQPTNDERLTLVTCWPYTNNTHRLIVVALPAGEAPPTNPGELE
jgi:sortase A